MIDKLNKQIERIKKKISKLDNKRIKLMKKKHDLKDLIDIEEMKEGKR